MSVATAPSKAARRNTTDEEIFTILAMAREEFGCLSPEVLEGVTRSQHLYIGDVLRVFGGRPTLQVPRLQSTTHVCAGKVCLKAGADRVSQEMGCEVIRHQTCIGLCQFAPVVLKSGRLLRRANRSSAA